MYFCDCHCDTITEAYNLDMNLYENSLHFDVKRQQLNGGGLQFMAIWIPSKYKNFGGTKYTIEVMNKYFDEIEKLRENSVDLVFVKDKMDLKEIAKKRSGLLLAIEGGEAIEGSLDVLRMFYRLGVRCMTLTWNHRNAIADGIQDKETSGGLTGFGRDVVREMNNLGMLVDVSHIAPKGFWDVIEVTKRPIIATHSNAKKVCNHPRNLDDEQIRALAKNNGVIGINIYPEFLENDSHKANLDSIYKHIEHILALVGSKHLAFGTDFDGIKDLPKGISGVESIPNVIEYLIKKNYSVEVIENLMYNNVIRILKDII